MRFRQVLSFELLAVVLREADVCRGIRSPLPSLASCNSVRPPLPPLPAASRCPTTVQQQAGSWTR